jgi:urease accessory protein
MGTESLLGLLQLADGLFPAGGHAHSFGLEAYVQAGAVDDREGVEDFLRALLEGTAGPCDAVAVVAAMRAASARDIEAALVLDARLDALKTAAELREASRQMGRQTLRVAAVLTDAPAVTALWSAVEDGRTHGHQPVAFGFASAAAGVPAVEAAAAFLYSTATVVVGAALRLLPLGQLQGQRTLWALRPLVARLAAEAAPRTEDDMWSFSPGLDIASMRHSRADARLFRS